MWEGWLCRKKNLQKIGNFAVQSIYRSYEDVMCTSSQSCSLPAGSGCGDGECGVYITEQKLLTALLEMQPDPCSKALQGIFVPELEEKVEL